MYKDGASNVGCIGVDFRSGHFHGGCAGRAKERDVSMPQIGFDEC